MSHRSYSPSVENETKYQGENLENRKKINKTKNYQLRKNDENYKKTFKNYDVNYDKNYEHKRRSESVYSNSKNISRKSIHNNQKNHSNDKIKSNYRDLDYDTKYRGREDFDNEYSNSKKQHRKSKGNIGKKKNYRESSNPGGFAKKSKMNSNQYYSKKYPKDPNIHKYSNVGYDTKSGEGVDGEYYNSEDYNINPKDKYARSSGMSDGNCELSDVDEEIAEPKSFRDRKKNIRIVTRSMWDSEPGNPEADKLPQQPFNHINYVDTSSPMCHSPEECIEVLKFIKERDQSIKHNFYIGGDSFIYEGKGWVADTNEETGFRKRAVDVAFIGTFSVKKPPKATMLEQAYDFVYYCITSRMIYQNFTCTMFKEYPSCD